MNEEEVRFNIYHTMKFPGEEQSYNRISVVDECIKGVIYGVLMDDPLEHSLVHSSFRKTDLPGTAVDFSEFDMEDDQIECTLALDSSPSVSEFEEKLEVTKPVCEIEKSAKEMVKEKKEGPVLKQLPDHLRYAFLGGESEFPVIISSALSEEEENKLIEVLRRHKGALAWSISDIKGISPTICMHKILMEENYKLTIEHQRRLNPAMK